MTARLVRTVLVASFVILAAADPSAAADRHFRTKLAGFNETPAILTAATGRFRGELNAAEDMLTFELTFTGLEGGFPFVAAIHIGQPNVAGAVSAVLCGPAPRPFCPAVVSGTITGTIVAADVIGPAAQGVPPLDLATLVDAIRAGLAYVNIVNVKYKGGEIRGQLR